MKEIIIIEKKLEKMNKQQIQKIYQILYDKNIQSSKQNIIKELLQPLHNKYKMELVEFQKGRPSMPWNHCFTHSWKIRGDLSIRVKNYPYSDR